MQAMCCIWQGHHVYFSFRAFRSSFKCGWKRLKHMLKLSKKNTPWFDKKLAKQSWVCQSIWWLNPRFQQVERFQASFQGYLGYPKACRRARRRNLRSRCDRSVRRRFRGRYSRYSWSLGRGMGRVVWPIELFKLRSSGDWDHSVDWIRNLSIDMLMIPSMERRFPSPLDNFNPKAWHSFLVLRDRESATFIAPGEWWALESRRVGIITNLLITRPSI